MTKPLVSIVLAAHNGAGTLPRCLKSIAAQNYAPLELVFVNDQSSDGTETIVNKWAKDNPQIRALIIANEQNLGLTKSLNKGVAAAGGELVARIDDDDWWLPNKLQQQVQYLQAHPDYGVIGCWYTNHRQNYQQPIKLPVTNKQIRSDIFKRNPFGHSCVVIRKKLLMQQTYDEAIRYGQDRDLWFRLLSLTKFANLPEFLCHRQVGGERTYAKQRAQIRQQLATTHKYIQRYRAAWLNYFYMIMPLLTFITPIWFKKFFYRLKSEHPWGAGKRQAP